MSPGIDPRMVIRTEPRQSTVNFEPNYLCGIEFDTPDFPWLFTPASPNGDRLRPWVALIVLKQSEFSVPSVAPNPLPTIAVQTHVGFAGSVRWMELGACADQRRCIAFGFAAPARRGT